MTREGRFLCQESSARPPFTGAVLTGGASRRMGTDKALMVVGGRPFALRALDALRSAGAVETLSIGGDLAALAALGFDARPDRYRDQGPLGGLLTALAEAAHPIVMVLACDLVAPDPAAVVAVVEALVADGPDGQADAAVPRRDGRPEPLHAAYRRRSRAALAAAWAAGERSPTLALARLEVVEPGPLDAAALADADEPGELPTHR